MWCDPHRSISPAGYRARHLCLRTVYVPAGRGPKVDQIWVNSMTASAKAGVISIGSQPNRKIACCPESRKKDQDPARIRKRFCKRPAEARSTTGQDDPDRERRERMHQEEALDEALKNTFPASDPVSLAQPQGIEQRVPRSASSVGIDTTAAQGFTTRAISSTDHS